MGKAGKARKKQKLLAQATTTDGHAVYHEDHGIEDRLDTAVCLLNTLSSRLPLYDDKLFKPLRIALYPLIQAQRDKFFEDPPPPPSLSEQEVKLLLSPTSIATTLSLTHTLSNDPDRFSSLECKDFRRALHPFVMYHLRKASVGEAARVKSAVRPLPPGWSEKHSNHDSQIDVSEKTSAPENAFPPEVVDKKKQSLSNRVAYFYRVGDWPGALRALHELRVSEDVPKLGSLQRWVRESDVETFQLTSMKTEASSHVLTGPTDPSSATTEAGKSAVAIPSYAMGNSSEVDSLSEDELRTRVLSQRLLYAVLHLMQTKVRNRINSMSVAIGKRKCRDTSVEESGGGVQESVDREILCRSCPIFHAPQSTVDPPSQYLPFKVATGLDALVCLHAFQAVSGTSFPVLQSEFMDTVSVVFNIPGKQRRPPSAHDLNIYSAPTSSLQSSAPIGSVSALLTLEEEAVASLSSLTCWKEYDSCTRENILHLVRLPSFRLLTPPRRHDIPGVTGAFLLTDILSPLECCQLMTMAETMNYTPDAVFGIDNVIWLGNDALMSLLCDRAGPLMPNVLNDRSFAGINARLRLFRYFAGAVYRPHIDGAWPGSGLKDGCFTDDAFGGDRHSQLTFLVYLNDGFDGGATTFFLPGEDENEDGSGAGVIEARGVRPKQGSVLCFPHGNAMGSLVHEGSAVQSGIKYVIRTDALYHV